MCYCLSIYKVSILCDISSILIYTFIVIYPVQIYLTYLLLSKALQMLNKNATKCFHGECLGVCVSVDDSVVLWHIYLCNFYAVRL